MSEFQEGDEVEWTERLGEDVSKNVKGRVSHFTPNGMMLETDDSPLPLQAKKVGDVWHAYSGKGFEFPLRTIIEPPT